MVTSAGDFPRTVTPTTDEALLAQECHSQWFASPLELRWFTSSLESVRMTSLQKALLVGVCGNVLAALCSTIIFRDPPGSAIRPMDMPIYLLVVAIGTLAAGARATFTAADEGHNRFGILVAAILFLTPFFTGLLALRFVVQIFHYQIKP